MTSRLRIASLLSSGTEMVCGLGLAEQLVGVGHECDYPAEANTKPRLTRSLIDSTTDSQAIDDEVRGRVSRGEPLYEVDAELLVELAPDVIITQAQCDVCAVKYEDVLSLVKNSSVLQGADVVALQPGRLEDVFSDIEDIGRRAGVAQRASRWLDELRGRVARIGNRTSAIPEQARPRVACVEWVKPLMLAANWTPQLIELAGGRHELTETGKHSVYADWDNVVDYDPECLLIAPCGFDTERGLVEAESLRAEPFWAQLSAVNDDRVFALDGNAYLHRSGPRLVDTIEIFAHLFHPQIFAPPPVDADAWRRVS